VNRTRTRSLVRRLVPALAVTGALALAVLASPGQAATGPTAPRAVPERPAPAYEQIIGSGSSWAGNAVSRWVADVAASGIRVVYTANGAAQGRKDYANKGVDFAVTDSPYRGKDPSTGAIDSPLGRSFAYLPIVGGGTSFPYNLVVGGQQVRNLRLSGETIAKIFTLQIDNWNDPAITRDNNGRSFPSIPIIPVVRADGAGITNQFTTWLVSQYPSLWRACNGGKVSPTDYYPLNCGADRGAMRGQTGSDGVMNFVKNEKAVGAIAMEEYSYPRLAQFPVAKMLNKAGYYTLPTQYNVAVALTKAEINENPRDPDYLTQKLDKVYVNSDRRTYPLSSYVYAIIPTASNDSRMKTAKRQSLVDFLKYSVCEGQSGIGPIGYSPLPVNLVQASLTQVNKLKVADSAVEFDASIIQNVKDCFNPTFVPGKPKENRLAQIAPMPDACDKVGAGPCGDDAGAYNDNPDEDGQVPGGGDGGDGGGDGGGGAGGDGGGGGGGAGGPGAGPGGTDAGGGELVDTDGDGVPDAPASGSGPVAGDGGTAEGAYPVATELAADSSASSQRMLTILVVGLFLGALLVPVVVGRAARRRPTR
jgi:phosphate transport system substrate-binding protein